MFMRLLARRFRSAAFPFLLTAAVAGSLMAGPPALSDFLLAGYDGHNCYNSPACRDNPLLIRADQDGNIVWQRPLPVVYWYHAGYIRNADRNVTEDSFYLATIFDASRVGGMHRILKYSKDGVLEWDRPIAAAGFADNFGNLVAPISISANPVLGGLYAGTGLGVACTGNNCRVDRIAASGSTVWSKVYANPVRWVTTDVRTGGAYVVGGIAAGAISRIDSSGNTIWTRTLPGHTPNEVLANPVDGGVYAGCDDYSHYTARLDPAGNVLWWLTDFPVPWPSGGTAYGRTVDPLSGALYIGGWYGRYGKVAPSGAPLWIVETATYNNYADARLDGNGVYISGNFQNAGIEKHDGNGSLVWRKWIGPSSWRGGFYDMPSVHVGAPAASGPGGCSPDTTPPKLTVPSAVTVNATSPGGATVSDATLGATAADTCSTATVTRIPSGNLFPIGSTTVTYTAADPAGNTSTATQTVTVTGASGQTAALLAVVNGADINGGVKNSLSVKLNGVMASIGRPGPAACNQLGAFIHELNAQAGKKVPEAMAAEWIAAAARIRAVLGC